MLTLEAMIIMLQSYCQLLSLICSSASEDIKQKERIVLSVSAIVHGQQTCVYWSVKYVPG